jgi:hypothetical protein
MNHTFFTVFCTGVRTFIYVLYTYIHVSLYMCHMFYWYLVPGTVHTVHNFCISYIPRGIINFTAVHSTDDIELFYYFGKKI